MRRILGRGAILVALAAWTVTIGGCATDDSPTAPDPIDEELPGDELEPEKPDPEEPVPTWPENLLEDGELTHGLYGWPETNFGRGNAATIGIDRLVGDPAVDFTLREPNGTAHSLADLLSERPVLMVHGSFT